MKRTVYDAATKALLAAAIARAKAAEARASEATAASFATATIVARIGRRLDIDSTLPVEVYCEAVEARVAELESQAAQGWRPVTEDWPPYDKCVPVRMRNGAIRWGFRRGDFWHLTVGKYGREGVTHAYVLPPAPQETE